MYLKCHKVENSVFAPHFHMHPNYASDGFVGGSRRHFKLISTHLFHMPTRRNPREWWDDNPQQSQFLTTAKSILGSILGPDVMYLGLVLVPGMVYTWYLADKWLASMIFWGMGAVDLPADSWKPPENSIVITALG
jgi:hypothetical protein